MPVTRRAEIARLFGRQVGDDDAVHTRLLAQRRECFLALLHNRIRVAKKDEGAVTPACRRFRTSSRQTSSVTPFASAVCVLRWMTDAVRQRIGEGHAEFDDVRARRDQRRDDRRDGLPIGMADRDVRDERRPPLRLRPGEGLADTRDACRS